MKNRWSALGIRLIGGRKGWEHEAQAESSRDKIHESKEGRVEKM